MIKYRQEIIAYTFRNYTRQHIRHLLSYLFNDNMSPYQENMFVAWPTGFGGRILNLGNDKSYLRWNIWLHWILFRFPLVVKLWQRRSLFLLPLPPDFRVEANGFIYCPTACIYSSELVRGKKGVYISGQSAKGDYLLLNSNIQVLPLCRTTQIFCLVLKIKL